MWHGKIKFNFLNFFFLKFKKKAICLFSILFSIFLQRGLKNIFSEKFTEIQFTYLVWDMCNASVTEQTECPYAVSLNTSFNNVQTFY